MIIQYGEGWLKFPERVWERSGKAEDGTDLWVTRPATMEDLKERKALETPEVETD